MPVSGPIPAVATMSGAFLFLFGVAFGALITWAIMRLAEPERDEKRRNDDG